MKTKIWLSGCAAAALGLAACSTVPTARIDSGQGQAGIPASGVAPLPDNQAILDQVKALGMRSYHTLSPAEARQQPSFADGVKAVMAARGIPLTPPPGVTTQDTQIEGAAGPLAARVYRPAGALGPLPSILYFHGGGFVLATIDTYDASARALAREAGAIVISVEYRKAPESKFPAQHDDALAAYRWTLANVARLGGDPAKVALAGESAGGNLAVATAVSARDARLAEPVGILAIYPISQSDLNTPSYQENANAMPLNRAAMAWFTHHTTRGAADAMDPRLNLVAANLRGLPAVTIIQAQIDPLKSDGDMLADSLRTAGVPVTVRLYERVTHEFFGADAVLAPAREAQRLAGQQLRAGFRP